MSRDEALHRAIADACLGVDAGEEIARDLRGFLVARGVEGQDVACSFGHRRGLAVYRSLVRNGLSSVVLRRLPRTRARLNGACEGRFDGDLAQFLAERGPRTRYLRDVPAEFFAWAVAGWMAEPRVPRCVPDLAAFELACFDLVAFEHAPPPEPLAAPAIDRALVFTPSTRIRRYAWAVHELNDADDSTETPACRDVNLLGYRDSDHVVRWLALTPLAAAILDRLLGGEPMGLAIERACEALHAAADRTEMARLFADLANRGVLLGARQHEAESTPV
jgi:uncharacterized protein